MGVVECDDGNVDNGDGCSSSCTQETGFACSGGSASAPDICQADAWPTFELKVTSSGSKSSLDTDKINSKI